MVQTSGSGDRRWKSCSHSEGFHKSSKEKRRNLLRENTGDRSGSQNVEESSITGVDRCHQFNCERLKIFLRAKLGLSSHGTSNGQRTRRTHSCSTAFKLCQFQKILKFSSSSQNTEKFFVELDPQITLSSNIRRTR